MNICVISGSPKGKYSITLQTALYLEKRFPACSFTTVHAGSRIHALEKDVSPLLSAIREADLLLFCYPVYTFLAPSQLARTIELIKASGVDIAGRFAAQITTSMHFFDTTAQRYIEENCADMALCCLGGLTAGMDDLLTEKGRKQAKDFWDLVLWRAANGVFAPPEKRRPAATPAYVRALPAVEKTDKREIVIVADLAAEGGALSDMVADFQAAAPMRTRVVNIREFPFSGGCLGCLSCASTGKCVYRDGFDDFLREKIQCADGIVYAFTVSDHAMGARFKMYDDRQFCNGHRPVTAGMPIGYIVRGDYAAEENLKAVIEGRADVGGNFLAGVATDAAGIARLIQTLSYALDTRISLPQSFPGVGGMKIFRDLICLMRGFMKADHRFYKQRGLYDFPQKKSGTILKMYLVGALMGSAAIRKKIGNRMNEGMIAPYQNVLNKD